MTLRWILRGWGRYSLVALLFVCGACAAQPRSTRKDIAPEGFTNMYTADWNGGLAADMEIQSADSRDIAIVDDPRQPKRKVVRIRVGKAEDFSHVANGAPRAELVMPNGVVFESGKDYLIKWSTFIENDFKFDSDQMVIITQIHQSALTGPPPIMLTLMGSGYTFSERGGKNPKHGHGTQICCADADQGKWVNWVLHYLPDPSGDKSITELWKNGVLVFKSSGVPNAYEGETRAYLKIGLYKPDWRSVASNVDQVELLYGPVSIQKH